MNTLILAITTYNRIEYLRECILSWKNTKTEDSNWILIVADDSSDDGTIEYLEALNIENTDVVILKNKRLGVHQQMNTILNYLENIEYDFCFKVDDDITFLKPGWDNLYYNTAIKTGFHHLVFCDKNWGKEQFLETKIVTDNLVGRIPMLHVQGCFYTFSPDVTKKVGFMDVDSFGFRGMGHVDFTMRCARAGFTNPKTPWDIAHSNSYISATKQEYKSVMPAMPIHVYDAFNRETKENVILKENRIHIAKQPKKIKLYTEFKQEIIEAMSVKIVNFEEEKKEIVSWYDIEILKIKDWYTNQYGYLPNWYLKLGKIFKLFK